MEKNPLSGEQQERTCISLATRLAEKQLREGTASPLIIQHYLRLGSPRAQLEEDRYRLENELIQAKTDAIRDEKQNRALVEEALEAFKRYSGVDDDA